MGRLHLIEIHEQRWCPSSLRDAMTDYLQYAENSARIYHSVGDLIRLGLDHSTEKRIVDLCSGGGGPWLRLAEDFEDTPIMLTDFYPNAAAFAHVREQVAGNVDYVNESVDVKAVPDSLPGLRTIFTAFHHFLPEDARGILEDAVAKGQPIAIFEATERKPPAIIAMSITWLMVLLMTPMIRPVKLSRFFWAYLFPVMLFAVPFDGVVSCLRTYSPEELETLTEGLDSFEWTIGTRTEGNSPIPLTYLVGYPKEGGE